MKLLLLLSSVWAVSGAMAALPPYYESARRITAVLESNDVGEKLGSGSMITSIQASAAGYLVRTDRCRLEVKVDCGEMPDGLVGPCPLILTAGDVVCTR